MARLPRNFRIRHLSLGLGAVLLFALAGPLRVWLAHGDLLGTRSIQVSDSTADATANYTVSFSGQTTGTVGSVRMQFCSNSALIGYPCTAPVGFDLSQAVLASQSGMTGFTISPDSTANVLLLTRAPGASTASNSTYEFTGVHNPSSNGSYFVRIETYASSDASGVHTDYGGLAFAMNDNINISTYVPPYLLFCTGTTIQPYDCDTANGNYIDFGEFSTAHPSAGQTQILAATNDEDGYTIRLDGTSPTSGNNVIPALSSPDVSRPGVSQFGMNLRANTTPHTGQDVQGPGNSTVQFGYDTPDFYKFHAGDTVVVANGVNDYRLYTVSYVVNIAKSQAPGVYVNTITYIGLADF